MRYIPILLSVTVLVGCSSTTSSTQVATAAVTIQPTQVVEPTNASTVAAGESDLCDDWFVKTQILRSDRITAGIDIGEVWVQENPDPAEFLQVLKDYRPHQDKFIEEWEKLGPHFEAQEFWEKDLASVQTESKAFDAMIEGLENSDLNRFEEGVSLFEAALQIGNEAETAMLNIRAKCIEQPTQAAEPTNASTVGAGESDLCDDWFFKSQILRSDRIAAGIDIGVVLQQENPDPAEFLQVLKDYRPHQDKFIEEWGKLGPHFEAQEFWEKDLASVQTSSKAFDAMIEGLENTDQVRFEEGVSLFQEASLLGIEAETAMLKVREKCER